jgi:pilus assembly protein CpaE
MSGTSSSLPVSLEVGRKVVAFVGDDVTATAVRTGLATLGEELDLRRGTLRGAIRYFEKETPGQAVIIDIDGADNAREMLEELARVCPPDVKVMLVGSNAEISFYRLVVHEMGATEYLHKPITRDIVQRLVMPHLMGEVSDSFTAAGGRIGRVVAVCGARGGVGTSSIALNLAVELTSTIKGHVALVDFHIQGGEVALMLGARPGPGLRIALEDAERVDSLFLERVAITIEPRLRLIAAEESFEDGLSVTAPGVRRVMDVLQQKFNFIVADIPMPIPPAMQHILQVARQVIVVLTPDVASLRDTRAIRNLVVGVTGADRVITLLNRSDMEGGLTVDLIEKGLGVRPDIIIPELGKGMLEAINLGVPAVQRVPGLRRSLSPLVQELTGVAPVSATRSIFRRLFRR